MDACFTDVITEFFSIAFHGILYYTSVYPENVFETRRKYGIVVYRVVHPEVCQYIDLCLKSIINCMKYGQLHRVEFVVTDDLYQALAKFVFDITKDNTFDETIDAYLVEFEQNLRAFYLLLASIQGKICNKSDDNSFTIFIHTNESTAVSVSMDMDEQEFPLVETQEKNDEMIQVIPLRRVALRSYQLDTYVEIK